MESTTSGSAPISNEVEATTTTPMSPTTPHAALHIQRRHPPEQMIGELDKRVLRNRYSSDASHAHAAFVSSFEPQDISHALSDESWINAMHSTLR